MAQTSAPVTITSRLGLAYRSRLRLVTLDDALALAMLAIAVVLVTSVGISHARGFRYGPIDEVAHVGYVERVAQSGVPPIGDGAIVAGPTQHVGATDVVLAPADPLGFPGGFVNGARVPQVEFIQPPLYYYALAPVALAVSSDRTVFALRLASVVFLLAALVLVFLAVRETAPDRPLAAGLATVILATMSGLTYTLSQVQNDALLMAMFALVFWLLCRDVPRRRVGYGLAAASGFLAVTQIVAIPFAAGALLWACWRAVAWPKSTPAVASRLLLPRLAVAAIPLMLWVVWNVGQYRSVFPGGGGLTIAGGPAGPALTDVFAAAQAAVSESFNDFWAVGFAPRQLDPRPPALLCSVFVICAIALLATGAITAARVRLAAWAGLAAAAFLSTFGTIFLAVVRSGGLSSYTGRYFVGVAVAWAALLALTIDAATARRIWLARGVSVALSLVLVHFALQFSTLGFRLF
ncbi:MAG TPA: glycosyltransferase family 39 protein [Gaiellales bacterium]|nr:glycosyltransferase family 39 protein [Gaiellales bacterium]